MRRSESTKANGPTTKGMASATSASATATSTRVNITMAKSTDKANTFGQVARCTMVNGLLAKRKGTAYGRGWRATAT